MNQLSPVLTYSAGGAGLKPGEKLINLGSRNFFLCQKPARSIHSTSYEEAMSVFPCTKFMDFLL